MNRRSIRPHDLEKKVETYSLPPISLGHKTLRSRNDDKMTGVIIEKILLRFIASPRIVDIVYYNNL